MRGQARGGLHHVNRCLDEIASYEHTLLISKANYLGDLEKWDEFAELLAYLKKRFPKDPEVLLEEASMHLAHGSWTKSLHSARRALKAIDPTQHNHRVAEEFLHDIMGGQSNGPRKKAPGSASCARGRP